MGILVGAGLVYGSTIVYQAAANDGVWDSLGILCRISIIVWLLSLPFIFAAWGRCYRACNNDPFPDGCRSGCEALWGGLFLLETLLLSIICGAIKFPPSPPG